MGNNGRDYYSSISGLEEMVKLMSETAEDEQDRKPAREIAARLLPHVLGDKWNDLSGRQRELLIDASAERLWFNFNTLRTSMEKNAEDAARQSIESEIAFLEANVRLSR